MKPSFALNLSQNGIGLLRRMADGWAEHGYAAFDDTEFEARLDALRAEADSLSPNGFTTKLILPASQILYCEVDAPGPDRASRRAQVAAALEGRTPYAVSDLVFDWSGRDRILSVAVVAKLTLDEAEDFAERHGFNPVSFVGLPEVGQFTGEPFFGTTRKSARYLPKGEQLTRDQDPVRIVAAPPAKQVETEPPQDGSDADDSDGLPEPNIQEPATVDAAPAPDDAVSVIRPAVAAPADIEAPFIALDDIPEMETEAPDEAAPSFASRRTTQDEPAERAPEGEIQADGATGPAESRLHLAADPIAPPLGPATVLIEEAGITAPVLNVPAGQDPEDDREGGGRRPRSGLGRALMNTLPEAKHGTQAQQKARRNGQTGAAEPGVFGATRQAHPAPPARIRLGLILAAVFVLMLVAVALWSVWFASDAAPRGEAPAVQTDPTDIAATPSPAPAPDDTPVAAAPAVAEPEAPAAEPAAEDVAAAPAIPSVEAAPEPQPATEATAALPPDPGPAAPDAATLWDAAPAIALGPEADAPGAPTVTSAAPVPEVPAPDATALPDPEALVADDQPQLQPLPPPYGTEIEFGPDGLILATPDGVVTPDGFTLISGRPPVTPAPAPRADPAPAAPTIAPDAAPGAAGEQSGTAPAVDGDAAGLAADAAASAVAEAMAALPEPVDPAHAARKPRARPAAVVQRAEAARAQAAAIAAAAAAAARAEAEALASATAAAVASSRRPVERPSSLAKAVEAAVSDAVTAAVTEAVSAPAPAPAPAPVAAPAPSAEPEEIDEPEPVQSVPNMPTTVTVAKQATVANAIDLGKINLIGVFGSSASRRALVRMPTGRLIKVKIGDRLDGGKVAAIGDSELTYVKNGRSYVLKMVQKG